MAKDVSIAVEKYINKQGEEKTKYVKIGTIMEGQNGEYMLLEPTVDLAGCLALQNMMNHKQGKEVRTNLIASVFERNNQQAPAQQASQQAALPPQDPLDDGIPFSSITYKHSMVM